jgi:hypothetical protein
MVTSSSAISASRDWAAWSRAAVLIMDGCLRILDLLFQVGDVTLDLLQLLHRLQFGVLVLTDAAFDGFDLGTHGCQFASVADLAPVHALLFGSQALLELGDLPVLLVQARLDAITVQAPIAQGLFQRRAPFHGLVELLLLRQVVQASTQAQQAAVGVAQCQQGVELLRIGHRVTFVVGPVATHAHGQVSMADAITGDVRPDSPASRRSRSHHRGMAACSVAWWPASMRATPAQARPGSRGGAGHR